MSDKLTPLQAELLKRADSIFGAISEAVGQAKDLAIEQLPDIAYQFIAYNRAYLTFVIAMSIIVFVVLQTVMIKYGNRTCKNRSYNKGRWDFEQWMPWICGTAISSLFCVTIFLANIRDLFMVWFAPKIFLIEQLVYLVRH